MPNYDFECKKCGEIKEDLLSFKYMEVGQVIPDEKCDCGGDLKRVESAKCNMAFKGLPTKQFHGSQFKKQKDKGDGRFPLRGESMVSMNG